MKPVRKEKPQRVVMPEEVSAPKINKTKIIHAVSIGSIILMFIAVIAMLVIANQTKALGEENYKTRNAEIMRLETELSEIKSRDLTQVTEITVTWNDATRVGAAMADTQNSYSKISMTSQTLKDDITKIADKMRTYMGDNNGAEPWYNVDGVSSRWVFKTDYGFLDDTITVMWLCLENETDYLLAYATGTYSKDTKLVTGLKYYQTSIGAGYVNSSPDIETTTGVTESVDETNQSEGEGE